MSALLFAPFLTRRREAIALEPGPAVSLKHVTKPCRESACAGRRERRVHGGDHIETEAPAAFGAGDSQSGYWSNRSRGRDDAGVSEAFFRVFAAEATAVLCRNGTDLET